MSRAPYRFGATAKAAQAAARELGSVAEDRLAETVRVALLGAERRGDIVATVVRRCVREPALSACVTSLGSPDGYSLSMQLEVVAWIVRWGGSPPDSWLEKLREFPLAGYGVGEQLRDGRALPAALFDGAAFSTSERFVAARLLIHERPGNADLVRVLRDTTIALEDRATLAELVDTHWLDAMVLERETQEAVGSLSWSDHGTTKLGFAGRVAVHRAELNNGPLGPLVSAAEGEWRQAREGFRLAGDPEGEALSAFYSGVVRHPPPSGVPFADVWGFVLARVRPSPSETASSHLDAAGALVSSPGPGHPLRAAYVLALVRAVEVGRCQPADRERLDTVLSTVPAWRSLLPATDATWWRVVRATREAKTAGDIAAALPDLLFVGTRVAWFETLVNAILERGGWLMDDGVPTELGHAVRGLAVYTLEHAREEACLACMDRLTDSDVTVVLRAAVEVATQSADLEERTKCNL